MFAMRQFVLLALTIGGLVLAGLTNPSLQDHQADVARAFAHENPVVGRWLGAGDVLAEFLAYRDYGLFSTTSLAGQRASFGAFGVVVAYPPEKNEIKEAIRQAIWKELPDHLRKEFPPSLQGPSRSHLPDTSDASSL